LYYLFWAEFVGEGEEGVRKQRVMECGKLGAENCYPERELEWKQARIH